MNTDKNIMTEKNLIVMSRVALNEYEVEKGVRLNLGKRKAFIDGFEKCWRLIDRTPAIDQWHYPSKGEYPKDGEWVLVIAKNASVVPTPGKWVMQYFAKSDNYLRSDNYFANKTYSIYALSVACWQYIIPPKEEA